MYDFVKEILYDDRVVTKPWGMTREEFLGYAPQDEKLLGPKYGINGTRPPMEGIHRGWVYSAFMHGLPVPEQVLVEHPDLYRIANADIPIRSLDELSNIYGPYSEERRQELVASFGNPMHSMGLGGLIYSWAQGYSGEKMSMAKEVIEHPEEAQRTQDVAQWILYGRGLRFIDLYRATMRTPSSWDTFTSLKEVAEWWSKYGQRGAVVGFNIPVGNIFTFHDAHPGFSYIGGYHLGGEKEFILNRRGIKDSIPLSTSCLL